MRGGIGQRYEGGKYEIDTQKRKPRFTEAKKKTFNVTWESFPSMAKATVPSPS